MAAKDAGIEKTEIQWPVTVRNFETEKGTKLHYLLHYDEEEKEIICPYEQSTDLLTGRKYQKGEAIWLKDWDGLILETEDKN